MEANMNRTELIKHLDDLIAQTRVSDDPEVQASTVVLLALSGTLYFPVLTVQLAQVVGEFSETTVKRYRNLSTKPSGVHWC